MEYGYVFDIQNCSLHDGPGLRTTVFFKGCPLNCLWCANPESQSFQPEVMFFKEKCTGCGKCLSVCPTGAVTTGVGCIGCGKCVEACLHEARRMVGKRMSSEDVMREIQKDKLLYEKSGGGVTFSGGEVLAQPAFAKELLDRCNEEGIHTLLDTSAYCQPKLFAELADKAQLIYIDLKAIDREVHRKLTGKDNDWILENFRYLDSNRRPFSVRMPIIPGYNDSEELIEATISFLKTLQSDFTLYLLPYHAYGKIKYERLGMKWNMGDMPNLSRESLEPLKDRLQREGLNAMIQ